MEPSAVKSVAALEKMVGSSAGGMLVSVIIPCFNVRPYVGATLESLLAQSHSAWEAIVIDDGSTDGTAELVLSCTDPRIRLVRQENQGVSAARNRGIALASGQAVLFLDADDWLAPDALARMTARLAGSSAVAAYGAFCFVTEDGSQVVRTKTGPFPDGDIVERLLVENLFANGGHMLIGREAIDAVGPFRSDLRFGEDWEYWCRLALSGSIAVVPGDAPLLFVRQRGTGAYLRMATDPDAFAPCTQAIFSNPVLVQRMDPRRLARLRAETDAENAWIIGRESIRHGNAKSGLGWLRRSFRQRPGVKRTVLLVIAHLLPMLPARLAGPFRPYRAG
jgi:hypothetical protein